VKHAVPPRIWRGMAVSLGLELLVGTVAVVLFIFGLPWLGGAIGAVLGIDVR